MKHPADYISDHLLVWTTLAFITGIALRPLIKLTETTTTLLAPSVVLFCLTLVALHFLKAAKTFLCLLIPFFVCLGCFHVHLKMQLPVDEHHIYNRITVKTEVVVLGTMTTMATFDGRTSQVTIEAENIRYRESPDLLPATGKILLRLQGAWPDHLSPGDKLVIRAELKRPDSFRTPGSFDYAQYLARRNIWVTGFVRSPLYLQVVHEKQNLFHTLRFLPERLRTRIGEQIDAATPTKQSGVYRAVLIGDRSQLDNETLEAFKGSGTMHILAISGIHMAVITTLLFGGIYWLLSRSEKLLLRFSVRKWAAFFSLPLLIGYGLLAGMNTPVFRAVIMSSIIILSICTDRKKSPAPLLAFAALLMLIINPLQLYTVSFQLSFSAIIGILFLLPILKNLLVTSKDSASQPSLIKRISNWLLAALLVSLVATLITAPLVLQSFNRFSTVGPLANLVMEPLICLWALPAGFLSLPFIFIEPAISSYLLQIGAYGLEIAIRWATLLSSFTFSTIWLPTPPTWLVCIYFFLLGAFGFGRLKSKRWTVFCLVLLAGCTVFFVYPPATFLKKDQDNFRISYLDVGQGSATLLEYPSGFRLLIDGGGSSFSSTTVGERVIAPFLWKKGIRTIDAIAITHPDADHYNGIPFIIKHFSPRTLWVRDKLGHDELFKDLIRLAERKEVEVIVPEDGQHLGDNSEDLTCITNISFQQEKSETPVPRNLANSGLVLKACSQNLCALFPGDIERAGENALTERGYNLQADILLAPHHGSITSNSADFLTAVSPQYLMVSAGKSSTGHFPHKGLAEESENRQITLLSTAAHGTLEVVAYQQGFRIYGNDRENENPLKPFEPENLSNPRQ